jgi:hypothetical protein
MPCDDPGVVVGAAWRTSVFFEQAMHAYIGLHAGQACACSIVNNKVCYDLDSIAMLACGGD